MTASHFTGYIAGVDPGSTTGLYFLGWHRVDGYTGTGEQHDTVDGVLHALAHWPIVAIAIERFVVGQRAARSNNRAGQADALNMIGAVRAAFAGRVPIIAYPAGLAKGWATDNRLKAAGLRVSGHRHAMDAARHALYTGRFHYRLPDPLYPYGGGQGHRAMGEWVDETHG